MKKILQAQHIDLRFRPTSRSHWERQAYAARTRHGSLIRHCSVKSTKVIATSRRGEKHAVLLPMSGSCDFGGGRGFSNWLEETHATVRTTDRAEDFLSLIWAP